MEESLINRSVCVATQHHNLYVPDVPQEPRRQAGPSYKFFWMKTRICLFVEPVERLIVVHSTMVLHLNVVRFGSVKHLLTVPHSTVIPICLFEMFNCCSFDNAPFKCFTLLVYETFDDATFNCETDPFVCCTLDGGAPFECCTQATV